MTDFEVSARQMRRPSWEIVNLCGLGCIDTWLDSEPAPQDPRCGARGEAVARAGWRPLGIRWKNDTGTEVVAVSTKRLRRAFVWCAHRKRYIWAEPGPVVCTHEHVIRYYGVRPWRQTLCGFRRPAKPGCA